MVHGCVSVAEFGDGDGAYPDRVDVLVGSEGSGLDVDRDGLGPFDAVEDLRDRQVGDVGLRLVVPVDVFDRDPGCHVSFFPAASRRFVGEPAGSGLCVACGGIAVRAVRSCAVRLPASGDWYSSGVGEARFLPRSSRYTVLVLVAAHMSGGCLCRFLCLVSSVMEVA